MSHTMAPATFDISPMENEIISIKRNWTFLILNVIKEFSVDFTCAFYKSLVFKSAEKKF